MFVDILFLLNIFQFEKSVGPAYTVYTLNSKHRVFADQTA